MEDAEDGHLDTKKEGWDPYFNIWIRNSWARLDGAGRREERDDDLRWISDRTSSVKTKNLPFARMKGR